MGNTSKTKQRPARTFSLKIKLGNDAMSTAEDVAQALREVVAHLEEGDGDFYLFPGTFRIRDGNGNTVGEAIAK